jgi:hypothetical protein
MRVVAHLVALAVLVPVSLTMSKGQDKTNSALVCEGEYSRIKGVGPNATPVRIDKWRMYALPDGSMRVDVEIPGIATTVAAKEHLGFTREFEPRSMDLIRFSGGRKSFELRCDYGSQRVSCDAESNDEPIARASLNQAKPYAFAFEAEIQPLDTPWLFQMVVWQAKRSPGKATVIPLVVIVEGENGEGISLKAAESTQVEYLGIEEIEVLNQKTAAYEFREGIPGEDDELTTFWFSKSGILLQLGEKDHPTTFLSAYSGPPLER